jgi:hypothetical protein
LSGRPPVPSGAARTPGLGGAQRIEQQVEPVAQRRQVFGPAGGLKVGDEHPRHPQAAPRRPAAARGSWRVASTRVVCDGLGDERAWDVKAATA